jgi:uncharacterized protein
MIMENKTFIGDIPTLSRMKNDGNKKPLIILSHGFSGSKENFDQDGQLNELANNGYCAVAIDNKFHGDRHGPTFDTTILKPSGKIDLLILRKAIKETADDISILINELLKADYIDENRIAMIGVSMGGFITYRAMITDKRIKVGIPIISSPYWDDIPGEIPAVVNQEENLEKFISYSAEFQPAGHVTEFYPTAILMQIGENDPHYNVKKVKRFYESLRALYVNNPERLRLIVYENTKHEFNKQMWEQTLNWLRLNL